MIAMHCNHPTGMNTNQTSPLQKGLKLFSGADFPIIQQLPPVAHTPPSLGPSEGLRQVSAPKTSHHQIKQADQVFISPNGTVLLTTVSLGRRPGHGCEQNCVCRTVSRLENCHTCTLIRGSCCQEMACKDWGYSIPHRTGA